MEKIVKPLPGILGFLAALVSLGVSIYLFTTLPPVGGDLWHPLTAALLMALFILLARGLTVIQPNHSRVLNLFGNYVGTVKENGWFFINPFYTAQNISLRAQNLESARLKVNDKMGNPIEIAAVIV